MNLLMNRALPVLAQYANDRRVHISTNIVTNGYHVIVRGAETRTRVFISHELVEDAQWELIDRVIREAVEEVMNEDIPAMEMTFDEVEREIADRTHAGYVNEYIARNIARDVAPNDPNPFQPRIAGLVAETFAPLNRNPREYYDTTNMIRGAMMEAPRRETYEDRETSVYDELIIETLTLLLKRFLINESQHRGAVDLVKQGDYRNAVQVMKSINSGDFI